MTELRSCLPKTKWHSPSIISSVAFAAFASVHLVDDFLSEVPLEFHLSVGATMLLALAFMTALVGLVAAASARSPLGYLGLAVAGVLITLAQLLKSFPEMSAQGPWHLGLPSELLALGLAVSAGLTAIFSFRAWRESRRWTNRPMG